MIKNFIDVMMESLLERTEVEWENSKNYKEIMKDYGENYAKVLNNLPEELGCKLIGNLEDAFNFLCAKACEYYYKQGLKDGVDIFKEFKGFNIEEKEKPIFPVSRAAEIEKEYNEMIKNEVPTHVSNKGECIYRKAFEDGRKEGYKEALI